MSLKLAYSKVLKVLIFASCFLGFTNNSFADIILQEYFSAGSLPAGWTNTAIQGAATWSFQNAPAFGSGSGTFYTVFDDASLGSGVTPNESALSTPSLDCSGRTAVYMNYQHHWYGVESTHGYIEISTDGGTVWTTIMDYEKVTRGSLAAPQDTTFDISGLAANQADVRVRFRYTDNSLAGQFWYIDDVTIYSDPDVGPTDLITPGYLGCSSSYGTAETVTVEITNHGFFPVSNVPITVNVTGGITQTLTGTLAGPIAPGATANYTFAATVDMSLEAVYNFEIYTTLPGDEYLFNDTLYTSRQQVINTYPYNMDFNGTDGGWFATGQSPPYNGGRNFELGTLPYLNGPQGQGDSWYVETVASNNGTFIWVESPIFNFSGLSNPQLFIDLKHSLHNSDYFHVEYSLNGGTTWTQLGNGTEPNWYNAANWWRNSYANPVDEWTTFQKSLCVLAGQPCVKFRVYGRPYYSAPNYSNYHLFAFDNIRIIDGPDVGITAYVDPVNIGCLFASDQVVTVEVFNYSCAPVSNVPVTCEITGAITQTLTGTVPGPIASESSVLYTFPATFDMTPVGTYNFVSYTSLAGDVYLNNDTMSTTIDVTNLLVDVFPYSEDFNSGNGYWFASGTNPPLNNGREFVLGNVPYLNGPQGNGDSWYVQTTQSNQADFIWVESPVFDFTDLTNPTLSMDIKHSLHNSDYFQVQYSLDGGGTWTQLGNGPDPMWYTTANWWQNTYSSPQDSWLHVEQELCQLSGEPCVKFRVYGRPYYSEPNYTGYHYFAFDNFAIDAGEPDDIMPIEIIMSDAGSCGAYSPAETITVVIENKTCRPLTDVPVDLQIDGGAIISEIMPGVIPAFGFYFYTFTATADLSAPGTHTISVTTNLATDGTPANDNLTEIRFSNAPINAFPYAEDFNANNGGWVSRTTNNTRIFDLDTLDYLNGPEGEGQSWFVRTTASNNGTFIWVESPIFDFTGLTDPQLFVDLKHSLHNSDYFHVEYSLNGGTTWTQLGDGSEPNWYNTTSWWRNSYANPVDQWTKHQKSLCALAGQPCVKLRFYGRPYYSAPNYSNYHLFAFDNVEIKDGPDVGVVAYIDPVNVGCLFASQQIVTVEVYNYGCSPISNVPVTVEVSGAATATLTGTVPGPIASESSVTYSFPGTFDMTNIGIYDFVGYTSYPGDIYQFNDTLVESINVNQLLVNTYPYFEDFNSGPAYWIPGGTNPPLNNGREFVLGNIPYLNGPQGNGDSWYVQTTSSNQADFIWVESPVFNFTNLTNPTLSMDIKHSLHNSDYFQVQYSTNGGTTWAQLGNGPDPAWYTTANWWQNTYSAPQDSWLTVSQELCQLSGESCVKFRVYGRPYYSEPNYTGYHYFGFDNFQISAGEPDDIMPIEIIMADAGSCTAFGPAETITVVLENKTCKPLYNVPIDLQIDGGAIISEVVPGPVPDFGFYFYTFTATADLSAVGTHTISVTTNLATDGVPSNDNLVETRFSGTAIATFPYVEDFNAGNAGWVSSTPINTRIFDLDTLDYLNGPEGMGQSWFVRTTASNNGSFIWVESPVFDFSGMINPQLAVDLKHSLHNSDYFHVEYSLNGGTTWTQLGSGADLNWYNGTNWWQNTYANPVDTWTTYQKSLCDLAGQTCVKFRFYGRPYYSAPNYANYHLFAFDNVQILEGGGDVGITAYIEPVDQGCLYNDTQYITVTVFNWGCQDISNVPVTCNISGVMSATFNEVVPGPIPADGSVNYTFSTPIDMTPVGVYNFETYTNLAGDISNTNDTLTTSINVDQVVISTIPYFEDFNSGPGYWIPTGQAPPTNNGRNFVLNPLPYLNGPEGKGDSWYVETTVSNQGTFIWVESPVFDFTGVNNPKMLFDIKHSLHNSDYFHVEYSLNGGTTWTQLGTSADPYWYNTVNWWRNSTSNPVDEWTTVEIPLCAMINQPCVKFRVYGRPYYSEPTYTGYHYFAFDDFHITDTPIDAELLFVSGCYGSEYSLDVTIFNNDRLCQTSTDINSIDISYQIDGGGVVTQTYTGLNIPFGGTEIITIPNVTVPTNGSSITVWCQNPNGLTDQIWENDTLTVTSANWPNCNDYCSNATNVGLGSTTISQTTNATTSPGIDPLFPCGNPTLENTVWYYFTTDSLGGLVEVWFENTICSPSTNGIQVSINQLSGVACDTANYTNVFCSNTGTTNDIYWGPNILPANTTYYITIDGYAGNDCIFDLVITGAVTVLPIELHQFNASCNGDEVVLQWSTLSESNNDYFEIQRSFNGVEFETIGYMNGSGNSVTQQSYIFRDGQTFSSTVYYRLKQVDTDGKYEILDVISLQCEGAEDEISIYPNPSINGSTLSINVKQKQSSVIEIFNAENKMISSIPVDLQVGGNNFHLNADGFERGVYFVKIKLENGTQMKRWVLIN
ncbi:T9SS type A sorting domain-containing protein [Paracrocinitomix mangrovi]|uniref:T9SS type A sorting domain-containing protein n=1 Tax=Paracrocinitomix mangrovi TaxID=2862509 RepID=UPI001C8EB974|nr:T9SS type A sorting domain-containing protein [Paracrocinitomix mangrovi]UKN03606.1 T9SS type A sorting domain-containing protein [Paracrocinitomix mangrovi]